MYDAGNRRAIRLPLEPTHPLVNTLQQAMRRQVVRALCDYQHGGRLPLALHRVMVTAADCASNAMYTAASCMPRMCRSRLIFMRLSTLLRCKLSSSAQRLRLLCDASVTSSGSLSGRRAGSRRGLGEGAARHGAAGRGGRKRQSGVALPEPLCAILLSVNIVHSQLPHSLCFRQAIEPNLYVLLTAHNVCVGAACTDAGGSDAVCPVGGSDCVRALTGALCQGASHLVTMRMLARQLCAAVLVLSMLASPTQPDFSCEPSHLRRLIPTLTMFRASTQSPDSSAAATDVKRRQAECLLCILSVLEGVLPQLSHLER